MVTIKFIPTIIRQSEKAITYIKISKLFKMTLLQFPYVYVYNSDNDINYNNSHI